MQKFLIIFRNYKKKCKEAAPKITIWKIYWNKYQKNYQLINAEIKSTNLIKITI